MDLSKLTLEALVSGRPDLVAALKAQHAAEFKADPKKAEQADLDAASANGAQFERLRIAQIVSKGNLPEYQGCGAIVQDAVVNGLSVKEAEDRMKDHRLKNLQNAGAPAVGAAGAEVVADLSRLSVEERCKVLWEKDPAVRADFDNVEQFILYEKKYASRHKAGSAK